MIKNKAIAFFLLWFEDHRKKKTVTTEARKEDWVNRERVGKKCVQTRLTLGQLMKQ